LEGLLLQLRHANEQRAHWRSLIAQEVLEDPLLLSLVRLCGVADIIAFALGAFIGDIKRFAGPKNLVKYVGLNPAFDDSGESQWSGGIGGHGNKHLRNLLVEGAQSIMRSSSALARWGRRLFARKGSANLVAAAVARKLVVAVWYLMMGRWTPLEDLEPRLVQKLGKILARIPDKQITASAKPRKTWREEAYDRIKTGRVYVLDPNKKFTPQPAAATP
jgi:hypothetical protein